MFMTCNPAHLLLTSLTSQIFGGGLSTMRKLILSSLASVLLASAGHAAAVVGERAAAMGAHTDGFQTVLAGSAPQMQMPTMQAMFNNSPLSGVHLPAAAQRGATGLGASQGGVADLLPAEGDSSSAMLLAGALVVAALVLRRLS